MTAYYNEIDPYAADWLENLIIEELIAFGHVDRRSIADVQPADLVGFDQCHFFAGIGGWSYALRMAGWPDDRPVWTGSCPCQPFSVAGKRKGFADERHLWPEFHRLIAERRPAVVFGEQVARAAEWLRTVRGDLEALDYAVGCLSIEAASVGALHRRDRFWFVADARGQQYQGGCAADERPISAELSSADASGAELRNESGRRGWPSGFGAAFVGNDGAAGLVANTNDRGQLQSGGGIGSLRRRLGDAGPYVADSDGERLSLAGSQQEGTDRRDTGRMFATSNWWCVEPDVGRVAHGVPARVGRLRAYGNAIVPQVASEFISAYLECRT